MGPCSQVGHVTGEANCLTNGWIVSGSLGGDGACARASPIAVWGGRHVMGEERDMFGKVHYHIGQEGQEPPGGAVLDSAQSSPT